MGTFRQSSGGPLVSCCLLTACGPEPLNMPVAYFTPGDWEPGEIKECQKAQWNNNELLASWLLQSIIGE